MQAGEQNTVGSNSFEAQPLPPNHKVLKLMRKQAGVLLNYFPQQHYSKHNEHNDTWFGTPKNARNPGHANHVLKTPL